jgi:hypothetical protein
MSAVTTISSGNLSNGNYTVAANKTGSLNNGAYIVNTSIAGTFTNAFVLLGGGGMGAQGGSTLADGSGADGADALMISSTFTITNLKNTGSLTGGGGGGGGSAGSLKGGDGGAGGGGGGPTGGSYRGGNGGTNGGSGGNGGVGRGYGGIRSGGGGGGGGGVGGGDGGAGAGAGFIFGMSGLSNGNGLGGGGGAGGGNGGASSSSTGKAGGGSGGGLGFNNNGGYLAGGDGGFGINNKGTITNLYNSQNLLNGYLQLYIRGKLPTNYYITILSDTNYGQLFASPNFPVTGTVNFNIDPNSTFTIGTTKTYTNVLSNITPSNTSGSAYNNIYTWKWNLTSRPVNNGNNVTVTNYDLSLTVYNTKIINNTGTGDAAIYNTLTYTNTADSINTPLDTTLYQVVGDIDTFTNNGVLLGGGGTGGGTGGGSAGNDGAHALLIDSNVTNVINNGSLTGGGGGGGGSSTYRGGNGGAGGGGGGGGLYGAGGNGGNSSISGGGGFGGFGAGGGGGFGGIYGGGGGGAGNGTNNKGGDGNNTKGGDGYNSSGGGGGFGGNSIPPPTNGGRGMNGGGSGGGGGGANGGSARGRNPTTPGGWEAGTSGGGGGGANATYIFGGAGGGSSSGESGGGGGAGCGNGGFGTSYSGGGGGSGGGQGHINISSIRTGGNGGFGIKNNGSITNLYNAQNLSGNYGPLYMAGTAPTKYYITILGDTSYGQLFSSSNGNLTNGLDLSGSINFNIDPASVLTIGMKTYTNVLSGVSLNVTTGTGTWQGKSYTWTLKKNTRTTDNNEITISNYDLSLNLIVPGIDISLSTFNRSKLVVDSSTNTPNVYSPFDVSYGTTDISLSYAKADINTILDFSLNNVSYPGILSPFDISTGLVTGDNSLNFTLYSSDRSSNVPYFVVVHVQTSNQFSTLTLYDQPVTFDASYSARLEVPYGVDDISGQYTLVDPSANVDLSVNNVKQQRGMSSPFDVSGLAVGDNSLNFMVTAYDKQTKQPYFVQVYMQTANTIKTLFLNKNQINLTNPSLRIDVSNGLSVISGSYYLEDTRATVDISVNTDYSRYSIAASFDVPELVTGDNALNLMVTAYDKKTVKNYPINVHVQTSNRFSNLYLNNQRIVFDNSFVGTRIDVSYNAYGITGDYYTVDPGTTVDVSVNTTYYTASDIDPSFSVGLQPKDNSLNFMVTSSDNTKQAYLAKVYMQTSTDFATLTLNSTLINWVVDSNGNNIGYLGVSFGIKDISGSYSLVDTLAKVDMSVNNVSFPNISSSSFNINNLQKGQNNVYFYVKSSDGFTKKIYYVNIGVQSTLSVSKLLIKPNGRVNFTTKNGSGKLTFMI